MFTHVTHMSIFVENQDKALDFYTNKFDFVVHTDAMMPNGFRWLTLCTKNNKNLEIAIMPANTSDEKAIVGKQAANTPLCCVATDDCYATYKTLQDRGVECLDKPQEEVWGISFSCKDLYGNIFYIVQENK